MLCKLKALHILQSCLPWNPLQQRIFTDINVYTASYRFSNSFQIQRVPSIMHTENKHQRFTTHHGWPRMTIDKRCQLIRITSNKMSAGAMDNMKQRMQWLTATAACLKHTQGGGIRRWASSRFSFTYIIYYRWVCFGIMVGGRTLSVYGRNFSIQILCFLGLWSSFVFAEYFSFFQVLVYVWN